MRALTVRPGVAGSARVEEVEPPESDGPAPGELATILATASEQVEHAARRGAGLTPRTAVITGAGPVGQLTPREEAR
jgi:threonine dehydrogenase-like Zn-dependent dehydrogenase